MLHNWPHLYASSLADVSDLCEWKAKDQGGYYEQSEAAAPLPYGIVGNQMVYREIVVRLRERHPASEDPPRMTEDRRRAEAEGQAHRPDARPHLWRRAHLVLPAPVDVRGRHEGA